MAELRNYFSFPGSSGVRYRTVIILWVLGLLCGSLLYRQSSGISVDLIRAACATPVCAGSSLLCTGLPFLLSVMVIGIAGNRLLLPICFGKACSVSFVACSVSAAFGSSGWLVRQLLLFGNLSVCVPLLVFWFRQTSGKGKPSRRELVIHGCIILAVTFVDNHFISPLLIRALL